IITRARSPFPPVPIKFQLRHLLILLGEGCCNGFFHIANKRRCLVNIGTDPLLAYRNSSCFYLCISHLNPLLERLILNNSHCVLLSLVLSMCQLQVISGSFWAFSGLFQGN